MGASHPWLPHAAGTMSCLFGDGAIPARALNLLEEPGLPVFPRVSPFLGAALPYVGVDVDRRPLLTSLGAASTAPQADDFRSSLQENGVFPSSILYLSVQGFPEASSGSILFPSHTGRCMQTAPTHS